MRLIPELLLPAVDLMSLEKIKRVATFLIANIPLQLVGYKPFNPIIGETFQCRIANSIDVYLEMTSHFPPIFNYYVVHKDLKIWGHRELEATGSPNGITARAKGDMNLKFSDGTHLVVKYGKFTMKGFIYGKRLFNFEDWYIVEDITNGLICPMKLSLKKEDAKYFNKLWGFKDSKMFPDFLLGFIAPSSEVKYDEKKNLYVVDKDAILSRVEGESTHYLDFDGKNYWTNGKVAIAEATKQDYTLPSDSYHREDILLFKNGKLELAQAAKMNLEEQQRRDIKSRAKSSPKLSNNK